MADKRIDTYTTVDSEPGDKALGVDDGGSTKLFNLGFQLPAGIVFDFGGTSAPDGTIACDGSAVSRTTYARLFAAIGTTWGVGDGSTTFNLPDMRETVAVGNGTRGSGVTEHDTYTVGEFKNDQMQGHYHEMTRPSGVPRWGVDAYDTVASNVSIIAAGGAGTKVGTISVIEPRNDLTHGEPRTGTTTRTKQAGVLKVITI